jgi:hypothetical protein
VTQYLHATVGVATLQAGWARMRAGFGLVESMCFEFEKADAIHVESLLELVTLGIEMVEIEAGPCVLAGGRSGDRKDLSKFPIQLECWKSPDRG